MGRGTSFSAALTSDAKPQTISTSSVDASNDNAVYAHAVSELWAQRFPSEDISYLLLSLRTGAVIAQRWEDANRPIPAGSLVKPFTAMAYVESHGFNFPHHLCAAGTCWLPRGHGDLGIVRAVALSCNSYFISLAGDVTPAEVIAVARRFGLNGPEAQASAEDMVGMHGAWREAPSAIASAYAELLGERSRPGVREIVAGMAQAARDGTAAGLSAGGSRTAVLAKTGTAHCTHHPSAPGDGFVVAAWPADAPTYLLLLREHGKPGAQAAVLAGRMLRALGRTLP
jgi:cell division protein FtsI/penicillin-binding protein 2